METIKIIDIARLIKEKKYENLPKKIKINNKTYEFDKTDNEYRRFNSGCSFTPLYEFMKNKGIEYFDDLIQMEVEIIEEEKEIEKILDIELLGQCDNWLQKRNVNIKSEFELNPYILEAITRNFKLLYHKQCELIDALNELRKEI